MKTNYDEYVLAYVILRVESVLNEIVTGNRTPLRTSVAPIRKQWRRVSPLLKRRAQNVIRRDALDWRRAESVGLTGEMIYLKREVLDSAVGIRTPHRLFDRDVKEAARRKKWSDSFFSKERIFVTPESSNLDAFLDLAKDLLGSLAKILGIDDVMEFVQEFISVVQTAMKVTRGV
jgi:hypothetical protein